MNGRLAARCVVALACSFVVVTGCSSSRSSSQKLCDDVASLQSSVQALQDVDIVRNGVSSLQSALDQVKSNASKVVDSAQAEFKPQVDAFESSLTALGDALDDVVANGTAAVQQAAQNVQTTGADLQRAIKSEKCT